MSIRDLLAAMLRRWYVVAGIGVVAALGVAWLAHDGGVYSTRTVVSLRYAESSVVAPDNGMGTESVIVFAGTVAAELNGGRAVPRYSSSEAPYYGAGIRQGTLVGVRDEGNQWSPHYTSALLELQIVGRTEAWVTQQQTALLARIDAIVAARQAAVTDTRERIVAEVEPLTTGISYIAYSRSTFLAAVGAVGAASLIVGGWLAVELDRRKGARSGRRGNRNRGAQGVLA